MNCQTYILLNNLRLHAYHGVMAQERQVGADFTVTLRIGYPWQPAMASDAVGDTLDYSSVYELVKREMTVPSNLLEHVGGRMVRALMKAWPDITSIDLWLTKVTPPMGADCDGAGIELHLINDKTQRG